MQVGLTFPAEGSSQNKGGSRATDGGNRQDSGDPGVSEHADNGSQGDAPGRYPSRQNLAAIHTRFTTLRPTPFQGHAVGHLVFSPEHNLLGQIR